jgi:hypothetical protein
LSGYFIIPALAKLLIGIQLVVCSFYKVTEGDTGWTTRLKHNLNVSLNLSGSSIGEGRFSRYTEINLNDVMMKKEYFKVWPESCNLSLEVNSVKDLEAGSD